MKILYLAHRIPYPPDKGEKIRAFHQIRQLSRRHKVHLACLIDAKADLKHVKTLQKYCASVDSVYRGKAVARLLAASSLWTSRPLSLASFYSRKLQKKIIQRLQSEGVDLIFIFSSVMAQYVRYVRGIPKVIDFVDVDSEKWRLYAHRYAFPLSWIYRIEGKRLADYERELVGALDHSILVSENEAVLLKRRVSGLPISVITNGVDFDYFAPHGNGKYNPISSGIIFTGAMDYFPNVDAVDYFCREIFPVIRMALPNSVFYIVGRNPARQVKELGRQPNVIVTGSVPDVRPYLARAGVAVAPFRLARGIQNKILEAMAMGVPVVGTSASFQGMQATGANGIRIADDSALFAQSVIALLKDSALREECSRQARHFVQLHHRWDDHGAQLFSLIQETVGRAAKQNGDLQARVN